MSKYTATKWNTAEDKKQFVAQFKKFVEKDFPEHLFTKKFYQRLSIMGGHIAHYDKFGFYSTWFADNAPRARFIKHWMHVPCYGDPTYTWCDAEQDIRTWLQANPSFLLRQEAAHAAAVEADERNEYERLRAKYDTADAVGRQVINDQR